MTKRSSKNLTQILGEKNTLLNLEKYFKEQKERPLTRYDPLVKYFPEKLQAMLNINLWFFWKQTKKYSKKLCQNKSRKKLEDKSIRQIKAWVNRDIRRIIESENDYYKPVRVGKFYSNNYIHYEGNGDRNKTYQSKKYLDEIRS